MRFRRQVSVVVALVVVLGLLQGASAGGASDSKMLKVPAHFVYVTGTTECTWGIGIDFPSVKGAASYLVKYYDGYYKRTISTGVAPSQAGTDPAAPKGTLYVGVTGGGYSPPCNSDTDATEGGRFSKGATAYAIFDKPIIKVSGTVKRRCAAGCAAHGSIAGVELTARRKSGGSASAVTGSDGTYQMALPKKGSWTFTPSGFGLKYDPPTQTIDIQRDRPGVDFAGITCPEGAPGFRFHVGRLLARAAATAPRGTYAGSSCLNTASVSWRPGSDTSARSLSITWMGKFRCGADDLATGAKKPILNAVQVRPGSQGHVLTVSPSGEVAFVLPIDLTAGYGVHGNLEPDGTGVITGSYTAGDNCQANMNGLKLKRP